MPGINFNAPVIRLGVDGPRAGGPPDNRNGGDRGGRGDRGGNDNMGNRGRMGLGMDNDRGPRNLDRERQQVRDNMLALQPPTREEVARTVFIGGLTEGAPNDDQLEAILRCAGKLRRWTRARDADDKRCKFGFAEYEDVESLEAASEIYQDVEVPLFNADGSAQKDEDAEEEVKKTKLLLVVDDASKKYIEEWKGRVKEDDDARQFRIDGCKEDLRSVIATLAKSAAVNGVNGHHDGDVVMGETNGNSAEVINIPTSTLEDDLADIPAEMRATVAEEIKNFRDRSNRRDIERLRREEEMEQNERNRATAAARANRQASPPPSAGAGRIPSGPRGTHGVSGAPSGPKGFRGAQLPSDYVNGVVFVPGVGPNGAGTHVSINREDDDAEESDDELERRREAKKNAELDAHHESQVQKWQAKERSRRAAADRERKRQDDEERNFARAREDMLARLANWNDDEQADIRKELYYKDRSVWLRNREAPRDTERRDDDHDRRAEEREKADQRRHEAEAQGQANSFLDSMGSDLGTKGAEREQAPAAGFGGLKFSLGSAAAAKTKQQQPAIKRAFADIEGLLEDEEDAAAAGTRRLELKTLQDTSTVPISGADLTEEEKGEARQQLATEIPTDSTALYAQQIKWKSLSRSLVDEQIKPFIEKKIVDYLGVQEDFLVDEIIQGIMDQKKPEVMEEELTGPLEDEAPLLVKKLWRLLVFWGECASRGL
ncbi:uncharacterized protein MYCGRDRAFT_41185 [Zymoseptoria tritici IPO323]|uniref:PWI domain-containing protein n=1 Tax=Zymoseptoria tritici (strain CBS 115943 / IPO323) TaxID=336722 RepID=F9X8L0_ZYMTI|nr:uncharacterized protein MYCGRDRAFT_41185 [Zymoseptoria tritici IPO323]EGP88225.1 hypothetical protein MYCGRDRAFT_41185 [Zymoseptoria tritici IPO323]